SAGVYAPSRRAIALAELRRNADSRAAAYHSPRRQLTHRPGGSRMANYPVNIGPRRVSPIVLALIALAIIMVVRRLRHPDSPSTPPKPAQPVAAPGEYLFCFWNVETLFDDKDNRRRPPDEEFDNWFADNAADREKKYGHLAEALVKFNGGNGPDILCAV